LHFFLLLLLKKKILIPFLVPSFITVRIHLVSPSLATEFTPHLLPFPKKKEKKRKFYILLAWALISRNANYIFHGTKMTITNGFPLSLPQFLFLF